MRSIAEFNHLPAPDFIEELAGIYEHSPWVAEAVEPQRPFDDRGDLAAAMHEAVENASENQRLDLIRAHPDLGGTLARGGGLTAESTREQAGLGLDRLSEAEYERFSTLNDRYRERFGIPFIICARMHTRESVLTAFEERLTHERDEEITEAISQVHLIARLRLDDKLA